MRLCISSFLATILITACGGDGSSNTQSGGNGGAGGTEPTPACDDRVIVAGELGGPCMDGAPECDGSSVCLVEQTFTIGPNIQNHPNGADYTFEVVDFPRDYCTPALAPSWPDTQCSAENALACADECGLCAPRYTDADICLRGCRAEVETNSTCREGYQCDLLSDVCDSGCSSDDECRVFLNDMDELFYDPDSTYSCNPQTNRCEHPGTPGAEAGIPCVRDEDCESRGICLDEQTFGFSSGYCSKIRCDIDACAGDGICASLDLGVPLCAERCEVGAGADEGDPNTYLNNTQGCRDGYTCFWTGTPSDPTGACVSGEFNAITENNIGSPCSVSGECYSPFGQGTCGDPEFTCSLIGEAPGLCNTGFGCTVLDCAVPGMPADVCGDDAECIVDPTSGASLCVARCASAEECAFSGACADLDGDPLTLDSVCLAFCLDDAECRAGETCNDSSECVPQS